MAAVTYLPRWLPLFALSGRRLPRWLVDWLDLIPAALLAALLAPALLVDRAGPTLDFGRSEVLVAVPTFLFALKTRSLGGTVMVGMLLYWGAQALF